VHRDEDKDFGKKAKASKKKNYKRIGKKMSSSKKVTKKRSE
jgi:hypothetical protein